MTTDSIFQKQWKSLIEQLSKDFPLRSPSSTDSILYLIGLQELGKPHQVFSREDKINLIHIGTCKVLEPYGYYFFQERDQEGWPHFRRAKDHLSLEGKEQEQLLKEAILHYFKKIEYFHNEE